MHWPHRVSAAVAKPSRKYPPIRNMLYRTAFAASVTSPERAPTTLKIENAAISAMLRIMMSRFIAMV